VSNQTGILHIVSTPIGNLGDMSQRAQQVLKSVAVIAAEDTRHSQKLLRHFAITTPCIAYHEHNERAMTEKLLARLQGGEDIALISDAGTPLLSDPGYHLVRAAHQHHIRVVPVPGASALLAALAASGLPTDHFVFEGFLPNKQAARQKQLTYIKYEPRTLVFYEAPHRILDSLMDMAAIFGPEREAVMARELTKTYETIRMDTLAGLIDWVGGDPQQQRGEIVLVVAGAAERAADEATEEVERVLRVLLQHLPVKQAAAIGAELTGEKKNKLYDYALKIKANT